MLAKEDLGKDAIVMNIKTISPKGVYKLFRKPLVEVTAAVDDNINYKTEKQKPALTPNVYKPANPDIIYDDPKPVYKVKTAADNFSEPSAIEQKLNNLQSLLEKQMIEKDVEEKKEEKKTEDNKSIAFIQLVYNQLMKNMRIS